MTSPNLTFISTTKDQPPRDLPEELGHVIIDLTEPKDLIAPAGVPFVGENAVTTGTATANHTVIAEIDPTTGQKTGRVALAPIPTIKDEVQ